MERTPSETVSILTQLYGSIKGLHTAAEMERDKHTELTKRLAEWPSLEASWRSEKEHLEASIRGLMADQTKAKEHTASLRLAMDESSFQNSEALKQLSLQVDDEATRRQQAQQRGTALEGTLRDKEDQLRQLRDRLMEAEKAVHETEIRLTTEYDALERRTSGASDRLADALTEERAAKNDAEARAARAV